MTTLVEVNEFYIVLSDEWDDGETSYKMIPVTQVTEIDIWTKPWIIFVGDESIKVDPGPFKIKDAQNILRNSIDPPRRKY